MSNLFKGAALFIGGAIAGAAAMLLLSPENLEKVRKEVSDLKAKAEEKVEELSKETKDESKEAKVKSRKSKVKSK